MPEENNVRFRNGYLVKDAMKEKKAEIVVDNNEIAVQNLMKLGK